MKVFVTLLLVCLLSVAVQAALPHGSEYIADFICPAPEPTVPEDGDVVCGTNCEGCEGDRMLCCPTTPECRSCIEGVSSDGEACVMEDEEEVAPRTVTLDEEECEFCVCVNGEFYCHELSEESGCDNLTLPIEGAACLLEDHYIQPGELTRVRSVEDEDDCEMCLCGNGVLFCREVSCRPDVTCEYDGDELSLGESVTDSDDGCTRCTCLESGDVDCVTSDGCVSVCVYNGRELEAGDTVQSTDGCNECTCSDDGSVGCTERACMCENGEERYYCFRSPCEGAVCPGQPEATCNDDYCGGCNTRWVLDEEDVTDSCFESPGPVEPNLVPTCPAADLDSCAVECPCSDSQLCCRGCCRDPVNLPSYEVPLSCPPQILSLSEDSETCDRECQIDGQCPGEKICCRSGCSSSCHYGEVPPDSCNAVRELLHDRDGAEDEEESLVGQFVPGCVDEGFFSPVQTWEQYRWCVNVVNGEPISDAYTGADGHFTCPNCTVNGRVFFPGQNFNDGCNNCRCSETGLAACTRRLCLDPCSLPMASGTCEDRETQYYFNSETRLCEQFVYSGCGGNANRFSSAYNCLHACKPESVCLLEWDEGEPCDDEGDTPARDLFYYYDGEEGECVEGIGYRCGDGGNRFNTGLDCLETCDPDNPGPTDVDGNSCWLIQCDIPICENNVQLVYSDDFCCPFCPNDVEECEEEDEFMCRDGSCIPDGRVCDGLGDCSDRSDERDGECDPTIIRCQFRCSDDECIPDNFVCDGVLDCSNSRDEHDCDSEYVPGAPFYPPPTECPTSSDLLGACDVSECLVDAECRSEEMCCLNNCNELSCTLPVASIPACRATVQRLGANVSYIPQCSATGNFQPVQCMTGGEGRFCWCANVLSGVPFSATSNSDDLDCKRCTYGDSEYFPGEEYTAEDGCNTCLCAASGESICTRRACVEEGCEVGRVSLDHGETKELDCLACTCLYGQLNCSRRECDRPDIGPETVQVEMPFAGDLPTTEDGQEELGRNVERTLLQLYGESMDLDESQVEVVELRQGSVIVVVVFKDREDRSGANVTVLVYQVEEDYKDGILVIRNGKDQPALVPSGEIKVEMVSQEQEEDDDDVEFVWWYGVIIGVGGAAVILAVLVAAIMVYSCFRKRRDNRVKVEGNTYADPNTDTVEKIPLDEKA